MFLQSPANDARHQIARDHEKDIDTDETTPEARNLEVVEHDGHDCPGTQSVDVMSKAGSGLHAVAEGLADL